MNKIFSKLSKAPIREAIIDLRFSKPVVADLKLLDQYKLLVEKDLPEMQHQKVASGSITISKDEGLLVKSLQEGVVGIQCFNSSKTLAVRAEFAGFSISHLGPYSTWEAFAEKARFEFERYTSVFGRHSMGRIALRYVNDFRIEPGVDFKTLFRTTPEISPTLPQGLYGFMMRLTIPFEDDVFANVSQLLEPRSNHSNLVFDIDVFKRVAIAPENEMWQKLNSLRNIKNEVFFESLTPSLIESLK